MDGDAARGPITGATAVLAILGDPIAHARTPALANAALAARGVDAVLAPLHVAATDLAAIVGALRGVRNFRGAVVTMPHKATVVPLLDVVTDEARQVGACNVIARTPDGRLVGTMLDGDGFVAGLRGAGHEPAGRRVLPAGAGGAAAGIAFALARAGVASLAIHNRTAEKARALAARVATAHPSVPVHAAGPDPSGHDVVVNATSLGMHPDDPLPVDVARLAPGTVAADVVIRAAPTPFLAAAATRGGRPHPGEPMLRAQIPLLLDFILGT